MIIKSEKTIPIFTTSDGKTFLCEKEASEYEKILVTDTNYVFYRLTSGFDQTEGRGFYSRHDIAIEKSYTGYDGILQLVVKYLKIQPMVNWYHGPINNLCITEIKLDQFLSTDKIRTIGDTSCYPKKLIVGNTRSTINTNYDFISFELLSKL